MFRLSLAALLVSIPLVAASADTPDDVVKYRHNAMEALGKHMKSASLIAKGKINPSKESMVMHAQSLHTAGPAMLGWFPKGTEPSNIKSDSKAEVWTKWADFEKASQAYTEETTKLLKAAEAGDVEAFRAQFGKVGKSCGSCHDTFRVEDD